MVLCGTEGARKAEFRWPPSRTRGARAAVSNFAIQTLYHHRPPRRKERRSYLRVRSRAGGGAGSRAARNRRIAAPRKRFIRARALRTGAPPSRNLQARRCAADSERSRRCSTCRRCRRCSSSLRFHRRQHGAQAARAQSTHRSVESLAPRCSRRRARGRRLRGFRSSLRSAIQAGHRARVGSKRSSGGVRRGRDPGLRTRRHHARSHARIVRISRSGRAAGGSRVDRSDLCRRLAGPGYCGDAVGA